MEYLSHTEALHQIKEFISHWKPKDTVPRVVLSYHQSVEKMKEAVHCWKIDVDNINENDPHIM